MNFDEAVKIVKEYCKEGKHSVVVTGNQGCGKTTLARKMMHEIINDGNVRNQEIFVDEVALDEQLYGLVILENLGDSICVTTHHAKNEKEYVRAILNSLNTHCVDEQEALSKAIDFADVFVHVVRIGNDFSVDKVSVICGDNDTELAIKVLGN